LYYVVDVPLEGI